MKPRIYRLARSLTIDSILVKSELPFSIETVEDSGTFELRFDVPRLRKYAGANYLTNVADIGASLALAIDGRRLTRLDFRRGVEPPRPRLVVYEARSRFSEEEMEIDVIGPGGTFIVYEIGETLTADVTVRRRARAGVPAPWRDPNEILERVRDELRETGERARLQCSFGYFEDSKYELQEWMEMAFAFMIDSGREPGLRWAWSFIESATVPMEREITRRMRLPVSGQPPGRVMVERLIKPTREPRISSIFLDSEPTRGIEN